MFFLARNEEGLYFWGETRQAFTAVDSYNENQRYTYVLALVLLSVLDREY